MDGHPAADGRPVETETFVEYGLGQLGDRDAEVLPESHEIHELQVDHHGLLVLGKPQDVLRLRHRLFSYGSDKSLQCRLASLTGADADDFVHAAHEDLAV